MKRTLLLAAFLAVTLVMAGGHSGAVAAASTVKPRLLSVDDGKFAVRPATVILGADGSLLIGNLYGHKGHDIRWQSWGPDKAHGVGTVWKNDQIPDNARGHFHSHPGNVTAWRVRKGKFTRLQIHWTQNGQTHSSGTQALRRVVSGKHSLWDWGPIG
jgi:hypothetical protein